MSEFFGSPIGQLTAVGAAVVLFLAAVGTATRFGRSGVRITTVTAVCLAMATALSFVKPFELYNGGSVTLLSMFFVTVVGYFFGLGPGLLAGATYSFIQLAVDPVVVSPVQAALDYLFGFGLLGVSGAFAGTRGGLYIGYIAGVTGRFIATLLSGVLFWSAYAPEGMNVWLYSALYNGGYIFAEAAITLVIISLPPVRGAVSRLRDRFARA
ncbi:MAG: energy-coupled thiamine transporter ThiT [Clostridiales bacterium]|jgi:thiamine transporter|nr:energy-coupled thiamine transporter ThiT [Clostridiales bacterium]